MIKSMWVCDSDGVPRKVERCLMVDDNGVVREVSFDEAFRHVMSLQQTRSHYFLVIAALLSLSQLALLLRLLLYG